jgi:hypothetical protein
MGESLNKICKEESMPHIATIFRWLGKHQVFCDNYARAKEESAEVYADQIIDIADEAYDDYDVNDRGQVIVNNEAIARSRLRVDARKWVASKLKPKKYGEYTRNEITGKDGGAVQVDVMAQILSEIGSRSSVPVAK